MDYGDGKLNGVYQFYTAYSKTDMCSTMANTKYATGSFTPYCVAPYQAVCGNGVVEPGEACDDKTSCCGQPSSSTPCQLTSTSQCSGETPCCSQCKFLPSSTTCLGGNGYCQNGFCAASACQGYSGLSYCGMVSNNPCRQQCLSGTTCSAGYTSPNLNVPDGTVCGTAPYSTCSNGACVASGSASAPVITYAWSVADWSGCSCTGVQNRNAYCLGSDGSVGVGGTQCPTSTKPVLTQSCTIPSSCIQYAWKVGTFSTCSVDCGGGIQTATVQCVASTSGTAVADSSCTGTKPSSSQLCNTQVCPTSWKFGDWSACNVGCGGGTQTRSASCMQTQNGLSVSVTASSCAAAGPTSQSCNTAACTPYVAGQPVVYSLSFGTWGSCSATCGTGQQTRPAYCVGNDGVTYDQSKCGCGSGTSTPTCPGSVQACNTNPCPTYAWTTPDWGTCTLNCGGGVQTRTVQCIDTTANTVVSSSNCPTAQPSGVQSCNTFTCSAYKWSADIWSQCSASCGGGTQTRTVTCVDSNNNVASDSACSSTGATQPPSTQVCNVQACPKYTWLSGSWSSCSAWCGGGTQTRSVSCVATGSLSSVSFSNCDTSNIPATAQYCNTQITCPLNSDVQWVLNSWSDCSSICGGDSIQNRTVTCQNSTTHLEVDPKFCPTDYIPEVSATCAGVVCPTYWYTSAWSTCSADCNAGQQTRTVECRYVDGDMQIDDARCTGTKPSNQADCNLFACPTWIPQPWGNCSTRCGDGVQSRQADCVTWDNQITTADACSALPIPALTQTCSNQPCPHWHRGPWGPCDAPCGSGNQTRPLVCEMPAGSPWNSQIVSDETLCPPIGSGDSGDGVGDAGVTAGKPATWELCNTDPCPAFYWNVVKYSDCSAACGGGTQTGSVVCVDSSSGSTTDNSNCLGTAPSASRSCNTDSCPTYSWLATTDWTACSVVCGSGVQTREVHCVDTTPATWKGVSYEITSSESLCSSVTAPKPVSSQACSQPNSVCWGNGGSETLPANGLCTAQGTCLCRAGYAGPTCDQQPSILNVRTNGASYTASGIAFGDPLTVQWSSTGSLPYVSVLLQRTHASNSSLNWPTPSYIAKDIINTGAFSWSVGERLSDLESGDGFTVQVWFSSTVQAVNADPFSIADPCAYKSCGTHGTCSTGGVCVCIPGYSGDTCALGPCERAMCSTSYGSCSNADYIGLPTTTSDTVGICLCGQNQKGYFDGFQCRTPPGCTPKCKNGADLFNVIIDLNGETSEALGQCGTCGCTNRWTGDDCSQCGLQCNNGGVASDSCSSCDCSAALGYFGSTCSCKYYAMRLRLDLLSTYTSPSEWIHDPVAVARFSRTLAIDLALAAGQSAGVNVQVNVVSLSIDTSTPTSLFADIQFGLECPTLAEDMVGGNGANMDTKSAKILRGMEGVSVDAPWVIRGASAQATEGEAFNNLLSSHTRKESGNAAYFPRAAMQQLSFASSKDSSSGSTTTTTTVTVAGETGPSTSTIPDSVVFTSDGRPSLLSVYNVVAAMFEDLSSPVYRGVITSSVKAAQVVSVSDPTGQDHPALPGAATDPFAAQQVGMSSSSGRKMALPIGAIVGIAIGALVLILAVVAGVFLYRRRSDPSKTLYSAPRSPLASQHQEMEGGTELASSAANSQAPSPAMTPNTTPPQRQRTISQNPNNPPLPPRNPRTAIAPVVLRNLLGAPRGHHDLASSPEGHQDVQSSPNGSPLGNRDIARSPTGDLETEEGVSGSPYAPRSLAPSPLGSPGGYLATPNEEVETPGVHVNVQ